MKTARNIVLSILLSLFFLNSSFAKNPSDFIQEITDNASKILSSDLSKNEKQNKLKDIAENTVDIRGIGFYTLGKFRKTLNEDKKKEYSILFKEYFLKSFSSRLVEYSNPKITVVSEEVLNENWVGGISLSSSVEKVTYGVVESNEGNYEMLIITNPDLQQFMSGPNVKMVR